MVSRRFRRLTRKSTCPAPSAPAFAIEKRSQAIAVIRSTRRHAEGRPVRLTRSRADAVRPGNQRAESARLAGLLDALLVARAIALAAIGAAIVPTAAGRSPVEGPQAKAIPTARGSAVGAVVGVCRAPALTFRVVRIAVKARIRTDEPHARSRRRAAVIIVLTAIVLERAGAVPCRVRNVATTGVTICADRSTRFEARRPDGADAARILLPTGTGAHPTLTLFAPTTGASVGIDALPFPAGLAGWAWRIAPGRHGCGRHGCGQVAALFLFLLFLLLPACLRIAKLE